MMRIVRNAIAATLLVLVLAPAGAAAQAQPEIWKTFASRLDVGVQLKVRLRDGQRFRATLIDAREDVLLLQPKTRVPVPVQPVTYEAILRLEQVKGGLGGGTAAAIGVASGVGAFFATMLFIVAALSS